MYSKPTTICSSIALEKGVLVPASGEQMDIIYPLTDITVKDFQTGFEVDATFESDLDFTK
ncbi:MAG: hypothetical protein MJY97_07045 [Bacteroidales bacterium]|nr:hypothetical protein [Bacteroidales bacterium]